MYFVTQNLVTILLMFVIYCGLDSDYRLSLWSTALFLSLSCWA